MIPFTGPSYQLETRAADIQRSVNLRPVPVESQTGSAGFMLQSNPGLILFSAGAAGAGRGCYAGNGRAFVVIGSGFYELKADGTLLSKGTVTGGTNPVQMDANTTQVFFAADPDGYTFNLATGAFSSSPDVVSIGGSKRVAYFDQYAIWQPPGTSTFFWSALGSAGVVDGLSFSSAEATPDFLVSHVVSNRQLYLFGQNSTEIWLNTGANPDAPFQRYDGTVMGVGCLAPYSAQVCNGVPVWLGSSKDGTGSVWMANGYTPQRISTRAIEESLATSTNLADAYAYCWSWRGSFFYCLRAPGLDTTWCYDFLSQSWHEQAELIDGAFAQHRIVATMVAFGKTLGLGEDGKIYEYRSDAYTYAGDTLCRERTSPHDAAGGGRQFFAQFEALVDTGVTGQAMLRYSNDGGSTYGDWRRRSLGNLGRQKERLIWSRCGSARDRVWQLRCTDPVPFSVVEAKAT